MAKRKKNENNLTLHNIFWLCNEFFKSQTEDSLTDYLKNNNLFVVDENGNLVKLENGNLALDLSKFGEIDFEELKKSLTTANRLKFFKESLKYHFSYTDEEIEQILLVGYTNPDLKLDGLEKNAKEIVGKILTDNIEIEDDNVSKYLLNILKFKNEGKLQEAGISEKQIKLYVNKLVVKLMSEGKQLNLSKEDAIELIRAFDLYLENPKTEKDHPHVTSVAKKVGIPVVLTGLVAGAVAGVMTAIGTVAGANALWTTDPLVNLASFATVGFVAGAVTAGIAIPSKNASTKKHFSKKYGRKSSTFDSIINAELDFSKNAEKSIDQQIEELGLPICELLNMIQATRQELIDNQTSKNIIKYYAMRKNNRNREHEVVAFVKFLQEQYPTLDETQQQNVRALAAHIVKHVEACYDENLCDLLAKKAAGKDVDKIRDMDIMSEIVLSGKDIKKVSEKKDVIKYMSANLVLRTLCGDNYSDTALEVIENVDTNEETNQSSKKLVVKLTEIIAKTRTQIVDDKAKKAEAEANKQAEVDAINKDNRIRAKKKLYLVAGGHLSEEEQLLEEELQKEIAEERAAKKEKRAEKMDSFKQSVKNLFHKKHVEQETEDHATEQPAVEQEVKEEPAPAPVEEQPAPAPVDEKPAEDENLKRLKERLPQDKQEQLEREKEAEKQRKAEEEAKRKEEEEKKKAAEEKKKAEPKKTKKKLSEMSVTEFLTQYTTPKGKISASKIATSMNNMEESTLFIKKLQQLQDESVEKTDEQKVLLDAINESATQLLAQQKAKIEKAEKALN